MQHLAYMQLFFNKIILHSCAYMISASSSGHPWAEEHRHLRKPEVSPSGWNRWPELPQAYNFRNSITRIIDQNQDSTVSEITFFSTLPACQEPKMENIQEFRCSPWEAGLLWQPYPEPGTFVIPFADHLPVLISVAENSSQLILKHLSIIGTD